MAGWLDLLLKQTEEMESPERYFWWSGIATISAVVRKNVWLSRGGKYPLYPNVYVALISATSGLRKGEPIRICRTVLERAGMTRIISGCNSIQGLIKELGGQKTLKSGVVIPDAQGILISSEFDSFLTEDPKALTQLTDLFNTHENEFDWIKTLKNSDNSVLRNLCLTMLVASNEVLFDSVVKRKDREGGFVARTFLVRESKIRGENALVDDEIPIDYGKLVARLLEVSAIKGQFKLTEESKTCFKQWYHELREENRNDKTGFYERLHDHVLKVAMLLSLSKKNELILEWDDIETAIDKCEECASSAANIIPSTESSNGDRPNAIKYIIQCLRDNNFVETKARMIRKLQQYGVYVSALENGMNELIKSGHAEKMILPEIDGDINQRTVYKFTNEGIDTYCKEMIRHFQRKKS